MQGRKFLMMFSDGVRDPQCVGDLFIGSSPWALLNPALDASVAMYPLDPRGSVPVIPGGDASTDLSGGLGFHGLTPAINDRLSWESSMLGSQRADLLTVAAETGGRSPVGNDLESAFREIQNASAYYDIGYYLPDLQADGGYHKLRIELRRPGLRIFVKKGYFAPIPFGGLSRGEKRNWLYKALLADQPLGQIEIGSRNSAFFNPPSPDITLDAAVRAHWWIPQEQASNRRWTMLVGVVQDENGTVIDKVEATNFWHSDEQLHQEGDYIAQSATYNLQLQLKPGRYELKLAVADLYAAVAGSYRTFLQVPDKAPLLPRASSLVLAERWLPAQNPAEIHWAVVQIKFSVSVVAQLTAKRRRLLQRLRLQRNSLFAGSLPLPILLHPGFPTLARRGVATAERQRGNVGIRDRNLLVRVLRNQPHHRLGQRRAVAPIEDVAFHPRCRPCA